jgi:hypothetical protein
MLPIHAHYVTPKLPEPLEPLREMVFKLWETWQRDTPKSAARFIRGSELCRPQRLTEPCRLNRASIHSSESQP